MLNTSALGNTTRPPQPQRSTSGSHPQSTHRQNNVPRLGNVRSASGQSHVVDLTADGPDAWNAEVWQQNQDRSGLAGASDTIVLNDDVQEIRPRKKARLDADAAFVQSPEQHGEAQSARHDVRDAYSKVPGESLDFPPRKLTAPVRSLPRRPANDPARESKGLNPPAMATRLPPPKLVADFNPWTGLHPEDILNEQVIKTGYSDKPPAPGQNESNSARQSIWPNLSQKNNIALSTLSHLFTQVLDKRQSLAKCTAPSSFKPPPRVTVTDTKREAWLKDLANTNIPLRRQSRTIPHGIRGKLLMEQCLAKSIPLQRAVWLAKCVGANELRSFRKKGVSSSSTAQGEAKWIRDWTVQVEQFIESVADSCGQANWRAKIDYAIKLTSAFYSEGLLDRDEYLDWLVRTFSSASMDKVPLWMLVVQIYWRDLTAFARTGRKLAVAILEHLHIIAERKKTVFEPLKQRLQQLITALAATAKGCLVLPSTWAKYKRLLVQEETTQNTGVRPAVADIIRRNEILAGPIGRTTDSTRSPLLGLYTMLDSVGLGVDMHKLSLKCLEVIPNHNELVRAVMHWSSTLYRRGHARVYIAATIIANLHGLGYDTDGAVLAYLRFPNSALPSEARQVWAVVGELARHDCFATGAYLQWIIASGAVFTSDKSSLATGLLATLSVENMPQRFRNLRMTLLARLGQVENDESIENAKREIELALESTHARSIDIQMTLLNLPESAKMVLRSWTHAKIKDMGQDSNISPVTFTALRSVLESLGDISTLTTLVENAVRTEDVRLLASVTDTVNMHALEFAVLGSFRHMVDLLVQQHKALRSQNLDRKFLLALTALVDRCPEKANIAKLLQSDLAAHEQQNSAAVCSPASDNLVGMQAGNLDSTAEIDAVFASGNSMDEQTMQRVFLRVIERSGKADADLTGAESGIDRWLNQLRSVDSAGFEKLAKDYVAATVHKGQVDHAALSGVTALVASRCLSFDKVAALGAQVPLKSAAIVLQLLAGPSPSSGLGMPEVYAFRLQQQRYCDGRPEEVASLLRKVADDPAFTFDAEWVIDLILRIITRHPGKLGKSFSDHQHSQAAQQAAARICKILLSQDQASTVAEIDACEVIRSANALNAPFTIGWLRVFSSGQAAAGAGKDEAVKSALLKAVADRSEVWPQLLSAAKPDSLKEIHTWARGRILAEITALQENRAQAGGELNDQLCEVLDVTYSSVKFEDDAAVLAVLTEKLKLQEKQLSDINITAKDCQDKLQTMSRILSILLHLCTLPAQTAPPTEAAKQSRINLLTALCTLLSHPRLQMRQPLLDHILDVAALHADSLTHGALSALARHTPLTNPRVLFLLGSHGTATSSSAYPPVALASRIQQPAQTQQQRALARQQQQRLPQPQEQPQQGSSAAASRIPPSPAARQQTTEVKLTPFPLRNWEIVPDSTPVMGENDTAVSLGLFGARKV